MTSNLSYLDLRGTTSDRVTFTDNTFIDSRTGYPAVWANRISANSPVERNRWENPDATQKYGWIFVFDNDGVPNTTVTGWSFRDNQINVASANNEAPVRIDSGFVPVERNTFGPLNRGTTAADDTSALSETGGSWFVWNLNANANGKLRTWYPSAAEIDASTGRARLALQPPTNTETPHPGTPVSIDVYYTPGSGGQRQADRYLGRLTGVTSAGTYDLNCSGCVAGGFLRVQTIAANGWTTQYSRIVQSVVGSIAGAPLATDLTPGQQVPVGSTVTGTAPAGSTVEVVNTDTGEQLCQTDVPESSLWSCQVGFDTTPGPATIVVNELDDDGLVVDSSDPIAVTVAPAAVTLAVAGGSTLAVGSPVTGTGNPGSVIEVTDTDTGEVLCTTVVAADGRWGCTIAFDATRGAATIVANALDGAGDVAASSDPVSVTIAAAPVTLITTEGEEVPVGGSVSGTGNPGATIEVVDADDDTVLCTTTVRPDGTWSCDLDEDAPVGPITIVANELSAGGGIAGSSSPVAITITPAPIVPGEAIDDERSYVPGEATTFDPLANDTAPQGASFLPDSVVLIDTNGDPQTTLVVDGEGTYEIDPVTGEITFTPEPDLSGPTTPVRYRVADDTGMTYEAQIRLSEAPVVGVSAFGPGSIAGALAGLMALALVTRRRRTVEAR